METTANIVQLSNGLSMPLIGLGTFQLVSKEAIVTAIGDLGYRHLDTAWLYQNEEIIGEALQEVLGSGRVKRGELFVTTKIWPSQFGDVEGAVRTSLKSLGLEYVDLYLIHWPT